MIIWINGAFGSGKTQVAYELHRRIPNSYVYDAENIGYFMSKNLPQENQKPNFQDYPIWREFNYSILEYISSNYNGTIIVPMTIIEPRYFEEIIEKLRKDEIEIRHFVLCASKQTLLNRLRSRFENKNSWGAQKIDLCIAAFENDIFNEKIDTEDLKIEEVADKIASTIGIKILPNNDNKLLKKYRQLTTQIKHIRS